MEALGHDLDRIDHGSFRCPDPANPRPQMLDELEQDAKVVFDPVLEGLAVIASIDPDQLEARHVSGKRVEQYFGSFSVADISRQHFHPEEQSQCVYQQVSFSALDFFSPIIATRIAAHRTGFDGLAVDNGCAGFGLAPKADANLSSQCRIDLFPNACPLPLAKIQINRTPVGQIVGQHPPGTPTAQDIQDPIDDFSALNFLRSTAWLGSRDQGFQDSPFFVCYI